MLANSALVVFGTSRALVKSHGEIYRWLNPKEAAQPPTGPVNSLFEIESSVTVQANNKAFVTFIRLCDCCLQRIKIWFLRAML